MLVSAGARRSATDALSPSSKAALALARRLLHMRKVDRTVNKRRPTVRVNTAAVRRVIESPKRTTAERPYPYQPYTSKESDSWNLTAPPSNSRPGNDR